MPLPEVRGTLPTWKHLHINSQLLDFLDHLDCVNPSSKPVSGSSSWGRHSSPSSRQRQTDYLGTSFCFGFLSRENSYAESNSSRVIATSVLGPLPGWIWDCCAPHCACVIVQHYEGSADASEVLLFLASQESFLSFQLSVTFKCIKYNTQNFFIQTIS